MRPLYFGELSKRQAFEDSFRNLPDSGHDVAPYLWCVKHVRRPAFEGAHDVVRHLLGIGKPWGTGQMIGHGSPDRSRLDGDNFDAGGMQAAAKSLQEEGERAFGGAVHVVGAASTISGNRRNGGK